MSRSEERRKALTDPSLEARFHGSPEPSLDHPEDSPLSFMCPACMAEPGEACYATSSDIPRRRPHRLRVLAQAKYLKPCPQCSAVGWVPVQGEEIKEVER